MIYNRFGDVCAVVEQYAPIVLTEHDSFLGQDTTLTVTPVKVRYPESVEGVTVAEVLRADNGLIEIQQTVKDAPMGTLTERQIEDLRGRFV